MLLRIRFHLARIAVQRCVRLEKRSVEDRTPRQIRLQLPCESGGVLSQCYMLVARCKTMYSCCQTGTNGNRRQALARIEILCPRALGDGPALLPAQNTKSPWSGSRPVAYIWQASRCSLRWSSHAALHCPAAEPSGLSSTSLPSDAVGKEGPEALLLGKVRLAEQQGCQDLPRNEGDI